MTNLEKRRYKYLCPTEDCEIQFVVVKLDPELLDCFGFCCPFCDATMELKGEYVDGNEKNG